VILSNFCVILFHRSYNLLASYGRPYWCGCRSAFVCVLSNFNLLFRW